MATPAELRRAIADLTSLAQGDLNALWQRVSTAAGAHEALSDVLPDLIATYGEAAAAIAADWYDDLREEASAAGRFMSIPAEIADPGAAALIGWATTQATDMDALRTLIAGGTQRRIANFSRLTITGSSIADPGARGWKRIGAGECDFCRMLLGRGAVYSEATADFQAHDHCNCQAAPDF